MLYEIIDEDNATIIGIVKEKQRINTYIEEFLQDKPCKENEVRKFFINHYMKYEQDWYPTGFITLNWVYNGKHYYDGEVLPTGEVVK